MLEILKPSHDKLEILKEPSKNCWINIIYPTEEELDWLQKYIELPQEIILSLKDLDEIPTIEHHNGFIFIIIRTPYNNQNNDLEYYTVPLGIMVSESYVITICYHENTVVDKLKNQRFPFRKTQLVFRLLLGSAKLYLSYLKEINKKMYILESELEKSLKNKSIINFLELEKSLVYFSTSLKSNEILIERILKNEILVKTNEDRQLLEKVIDENKQAIEMTKIFANILSSTLDAFASIISNNLNIVMKILASITIILALPTLVTSIYGMNIPLPFQNYEHSFIIVMGISLVLVSVCTILLWKKEFI